uniref:Auxin-induced protein X10A n=1 Tax=Cajanus cajan TaxID=3821 RepID=A0A151TMP5_CAJCA|nr:Auxin-induced protein X10A [Cajanus cajan]
MGIRLVPEIFQHARQILRVRSQSRQRFSGESSNNIFYVPKSHFAVYVGNEEHKTRFVVPISYLRQPLFQDLLNRAEEDFGFDHPMDNLLIPCAIDDFLNLTSRLNS